MIQKIIMFMYLALTFALGAYLSKKNKSVKDVFIGAGGMSLLLIIPFQFAELIGSTAVIAGAAQGKTMGVSVMWPYFGQGFGCVIAAFVLADVYKAYGKAGAVSVPEIFQRRFSKSCAIVLSAVNIIFFFVSFANQPKAAAAVLGPMFGIDVTVMVIILSVIFAFLASFGGLKSIAGMNVIHTFFMLFGAALMAMFAVRLAGGWDNMVMNVPPQLFSFAQPSAATVIANLVSSCIASLVGVSAATIMFGAKSPLHGKIGLAGSSVLVAVLMLLLATVGIASNVVIGGGYDNSTYYVMAEKISPFMAGMAAMVLVAAILSSATTFLLFIMTYFTKTFYPLFRPNATDAEIMRFNKIGTFVIALLGVGYSLLGITLYDSFTAILQMRSIAGITILLGAYWKKMSSRAAFWGMLVGAVTSLVWTVMGSPNGIAAFWPAAAVGTVIMVVLTLTSKAEIDPGYEDYQKLLAEADQKASE